MTGFESWDLDQLAARILKGCMSTLLPTLTSIVNLSLQSCVYSWAARILQLRLSSLNPELLHIFSRAIGVKILFVGAMLYQLFHPLVPSRVSANDSHFLVGRNRVTSEQNLCTEIFYNVLQTLCDCFKYLPKEIISNLTKCRKQFLKFA